MLTYVIREKEIIKKSEAFRNYFLSSKKIINKYKKEQNRICLITIPIYKKMNEKRKKKYFGKICKFLERKGVKKICIQDIKNQFLIKILKSRFEVVNGKKVFIHFFNEIMNFFAEKKGFSLEECELIFISNNPKKVEELIIKIIKSVKNISVFTTAPDNFKKLQENILKEFGVFIRCIGKDSKLKKHNRIYVNCESLPLLSDHYFSKVFLFDLYQIYHKAYKDVLFSYKTEEDIFIKKEKIEKNFSFTESYFEMSGFSRENFKIMDIKK